MSLFQRKLAVVWAFLTLFTLINLSCGGRNNSALKIASTDSWITKERKRIDTELSDAVRRCMKAEGYNFEDNTKSTYELPPPNDVSAIKSYRKTEGFGLRSLAKMRSAFKESNVQPQGYSEQLSACRSQGGEAVKVDIDAFAKATESLGQARLRILSEPSVRRSLESYSRCMKESGYTVETPEDTLKLVLLRFTQDKGKSEVYEYERRVADDEIGCLDTLGPYISELQKVQQSTFSRLGLK